MTNTDTQTDQTDHAPLSDEPELTLVYRGECSSITGRSTLTYEVGHKPGDEPNILHLRISDNSGKGMWCKDWATVERVESVLKNTTEITARTLNEVHPGKSINTGGFLLAVLKDLGLVEPKADNSRHHQRLAGSIFDAVKARVEEARSAEKKAARKVKET